VGRLAVAFAAYMAARQVLVEELGQAGENAPGTMVILAIGRPASAGAIALAARRARQAVGSAPDGQLYVNLCAHDSGEPVVTAAVLAGTDMDLGGAARAVPRLGALLSYLVYGTRPAGHGGLPRGWPVRLQPAV
jgi:hypothetical protein